MSIVSLQKELAFVSSYDLDNQPKEYVEYLFDYKTNILVPFTPENVVIFQSDADGNIYNLDRDEYEYYINNKKEPTFFDKVKKFFSLNKEPATNEFTISLCSQVSSFTIADEVILRNVFDSHNESGAELVVLRHPFIEPIGPDVPGVFFCMSTKNFCMMYYTEDRAALKKYGNVVT